MSGKNRILIVEDEEAIAKMIAMNLEVSNYDTEIYYNGSEAEAALVQDHDYDLGLLDVMLPGKTGFDVCRELRKTLHLPIIMVTAKKKTLTKSGDWGWEQTIIW